MRESLLRSFLSVTPGTTLFVSLSQITNTEYFAPLLTVNQHASHTVLEEIPSVDTFASLSNWLMRPVPTVTTAVRRFRERYFEDNYVIGEYASKTFPRLITNCFL